MPIKISMALQNANFHETREYIFANISCTFIKIGLQMYKTQTKFHYYPQVKYAFQCTNLHETHTYSMALCDNLVQQS